MTEGAQVKLLELLPKESDRRAMIKTVTERAREENISLDSSIWWWLADHEVRGVMAEDVIEMYQIEITEKV